MHVVCSYVSVCRKRVPTQLFPDQVGNEQLTEHEKRKMRALKWEASQR